MSPTSPSSSAQAAREALGVRLAQLRRDAGLNGRELSARCGWHPAKTSRIQHGASVPSDDDIRAWCGACGAEDQAADLIAVARAVDSLYVEWRRRHRNGLRKAQEDFNALHRRTRVCRAYVSNVIPGFLQTPAYATALLNTITTFQGTPDDVPEAVATRIARSRFLYEGGHRFHVLIEECVLRYRLGDAATMAAQLHRLLTVMPLATVSLGIIPGDAPRAVWPLEAFTLCDGRHAVVETLTAEINVVQPSEVADYRRAFSQLARMAVYGERARELINSAARGLS
ncbi:helix-turn-helix transcriptional regulator [Streptomyces sp. NPDC093252]|uniref:helix-turn-helix domain-containing protein n=1 Tax=Streptomyces sp. NPDC093252 TaxID=3154980 RepID=UPI00343A6AF1